MKGHSLITKTLLKTANCKLLIQTLKMMLTLFFFKNVGLLYFLVVDFHVILYFFTKVMT